MVDACPDLCARGGGFGRSVSYWVLADRKPLITECSPPCAGASGVWGCGNGIFVPKPQKVQRGEYEEGEERGGDQTADHDGGKGSLHFGADGGVERHRHKPDAGDRSCHNHGAETLVCGVMRGFGGAVFLMQLLNARDQDNTVHDGDAKEGDKSNNGDHRKREDAGGECSTTTARRS